MLSEQTNLSQKVKIISKISEYKPRKHVFGAYLYSIGTQKGNLHPLSVMMCRVTFFILGPTQRNQCLLQQTQEKLGEVFGKNAGEWTGREEISKEEISGSWYSIHSYRLKTENL